MKRQATSIVQMRIRYIIALATLGVLVLSGHFTINMVGHTAAEDGAAINIAGRQRMLSQRIAMTAERVELAIAHNSHVEAEDAAAALTSTVDQFRDGYAALSKRDGTLGLNGSNSPQLQEEIDSIGPETFALAEAAGALLEIYPQALAIGDESLLIDAVGSVIFASETFLPEMEEVVGAFQAEQEMHLGGLMRLHLLIVGVSVLILIAEGLWVFEPAVRAIASQFKRAEDEAVRAKQSEQAKTAFLANMSHEIRTPMTAILGFADVLDDPRADEAQRDQAIGTVKRQGKHLLAVINDILDISKLEAGKVALSIAECDLGNVVEDVMSITRPVTKEKSIGFDIEIGQEVPRHVLCDDGRVRQILFNLVGNAVKFTEQGSVRLRVSSNPIEGALEGDPDHEICFEVIDTGIGLTPEQLKNLFQPFQQADASTTRKYGGTGLGLSISRQLAHLMSGELNAASKSKEGSLFSLTLPVRAVGKQRLADKQTQLAQEKQTTPVRKPGANLPLRRVKVLLAEDGPDNQKLISFILSRWGAEVQVVGDGQAAVDAIAAAHYDIVLMDMQMPIKDGYAASRELRAKGCQLPIIALTAHAMAEDRRKCIDAGCSDYATKPIDKPELLRVCLEALSDRRKAA